MSSFARGTRLSLEALETRETPAGRVFLIYVTGPSPERLGSDASDPAQVRLTADQSPSSAPEGHRHGGVLIYNFYTSGATSGNA